jgi:hypothetical protein
MKKIVIPVVLLFGLLLAATIGASTVAATKPEWTTKQDAVVITPPTEAPPSHAAEAGTIKAHVNVPERAIDRSPALQYEVNPD